MLITSISRRHHDAYEEITHRILHCSLVQDLQEPISLCSVEKVATVMFLHEFRDVLRHFLVCVIDQEVFLHALDLGQGSMDKGKLSSSKVIHTHFKVFM
jgi:hypothetical protein